MNDWTSEDGAVRLICGDCRDVLPTLSGVHACVTDPPYGLAFMGKRWDYDVPAVAIWEAVLVSLLPGAHLLSFAGTRTQHRMAVNIEDAGFEIRDMIAWVYGSGFPKSLDVSKAIDKAAGAEREQTGEYPSWRDHRQWRDTEGREDRLELVRRDAPATPAARRWSGWGTALKPAMEPITVARRPLIGTVAANVLEFGTGGLNVDGCRVSPGEYVPGGGGGRHGATWEQHCGTGMFRSDRVHKQGAHNSGRWPANLIHDGSEEVVGLLNDAARFFYCCKASKADRDEGCEAIPERPKWKHEGHNHCLNSGFRMENGIATGPKADSSLGRNHHPTVKPTALMRYLCRLVTPPGGIVLDPFMGSGSTGKAAVLEGFRFIGIERDPGYFEIAKRRIQAAMDKRAEQLIPAA